MKSFEEKLDDIKNNINLDKYVHDKDVWVRVAVAKQGAFLEELKNDVYGEVRATVADQGAYLDELKNDKYWLVSEIANQKLKEKDHEIENIR